MGTKPKVSLCMIVKNEEEHLSESLESVRAFVDEIIVVDTGSTDRTIEIAQLNGAQVYSFAWSHDFAAAKNGMISHATGDWILVLDADERVSSELASRIPVLIREGSVAAYSVPRKNYIFGKWIRTMGWWPDSQIRLFRKGKAHYKGIIHETPEVQGRVRALPSDPDLALIHINYTSVFSFIEKLNRYTTAIAKDLQSSGAKFRWWQLLYRPLREFVKRYIYYQGFRQGLYGLLLSMLMSFYHLVIWAKLWEMQKDNPQN